jgi:predicted site-specific integrase-resolvase
MTPTKPACDPDRRYNQKEAAQLLGVERHTIRRWELDGCIRFEIRKAGRVKFTTGRQILKCWGATYL